MKKELSVDEAWERFLELHLEDYTTDEHIKAVGEYLEDYPEDELLDGFADWVVGLFDDWYERVEGEAADERADWRLSAREMGR